MASRQRRRAWVVDRVVALNRSVSTPERHSEGAPVTVWMAAWMTAKGVVEGGEGGLSSTLAPVHGSRESGALGRASVAMSSVSP